MARDLKQGDSFVNVSVVDLAASLWTIEVPFFDKDRPFFYKEVKGEKSINFVFETVGAAGTPTKDYILKWKDAHLITELPHPIAICKRTIWQRRWYLREVRKPCIEAIHLQQSANLAEVSDMCLASVAIALGFTKGHEAVVARPNDIRNLMVGTDAPHWLWEHGVRTLNDLKERVDKGVDFIISEENKDNPVAIAIAAYINIVAWLDYFRNTAKPYKSFELSTGKPLWVREGSTKYADLIRHGYRPK